MKVKPLSPKLEKYLLKHGLVRKFGKQVNLLQQNPKHHSLNTEKLSPKTAGLYSFRIDRQYRAIFIVLLSGEIQIVDINNHYDQ